VGESLHGGQQRCNWVCGENLNSKKENDKKVGDTE